MAGWAKFHRSLLDWEWFNDSKTLHVFVALLLKTNHSNGNWRGHEVKRGQLITGRKELSKITGISEQSIRTILVRLEKSGELTIKPTNRFSLITIINWETYQFEDDKSTSKLTNNQPATNQQLTTNKKVKNEKKEPKHKHGNYKHVLLTDEEYEKLKLKFNSKADDKIKDMDEAIEMKGYKYKSHYLAILKWDQNKKPNSDDRYEAEIYQ